MRSPGSNTGSLRIHQPADVGLRGGLIFLSLSVFFAKTELLSATGRYWPNSAYRSLHKPAVRQEQLNLAGY